MIYPYNYFYLQLLQLLQLFTIITITTIIFINKFLFKTPHHWHNDKIEINLNSVFCLTFISA